MIVVSDVLDAEVLATSVGDRLIVSAWRSGARVAPNLAVTAWSASWDATTDQVSQGRLTLEVADPEGTLAPWGMGDALAPGGSRVRLLWVSGSSGMTCPLGTWRIRSAKPSEWWRTLPGGSVSLVPGGGSVSLSLEEDVTATAALSRIDGDAPVAGASVLAELRRLLVDCGAVDATLAPADRTIPASYTAWPESRTDAVGDLLDMLGARSRVGGDGALQVVPMAGVGPVWTIQGGTGGALVSSDRELSDDRVYNAATSKTSSTDGSAPLVGRAYLTAGPLAWGGPYGRVPIFHQAIATSQDGVEADARSYLATTATSGTVDLSVYCLAHPAVQVHDVVTLVAPTVSGDQALTGRIVGKRWGSADGGVPAKSMTLTVRVSTETLEMIAQRARRG